VKTEIVYAPKLPQRSQFPANSVLFYDRILDRQPSFKQWRRAFSYAFPLTAGESLKTLDSLQKILKIMVSKGLPQTTELTFIAVGGGSVGDFVGFLASIFLRGRNFVQIPSTWLAAIDSAHGGKNGLNFNAVKNQIGTIYPASQVYLVRTLLESQPIEREDEAFGEVLKMAIINTPKILQNKVKSPLFDSLPELISAKMKIVKMDPDEKRGARRVLNLGHTVGHVLESLFQLPHGEAVKLGILFSARWSFQLGLLKQPDFVQIWKAVHSRGDNDLQTLLGKISFTEVRHLLSKDKKLVSSTEIDFIFISKIGKVLRRKVSLDSLINEMRRQKQEY